MREIRLTVGELREMLERLPEESELIFSCQETNATLGFRKLRGHDENTVQIDLGSAESGKVTLLPQAIAQ